MTKIVDATTGEVLGTLVSDGNGSVEYHVQTELYDIEDVCDEEDKVINLENKYYFKGLNLFILFANFYL